MKNLIKNILIITILLFPINVLAEGGITVSPSTLTIEEGSSKTFTISAYNTIGDISISSSDSNVASVNPNEWSTEIIEEKQTKTGTITVTGKNVGTATITLTFDSATFDAEDLSGQTKTITVNVVKKNTTNDNNDNNNIQKYTITTKYVDSNGNTIKDATSETKNEGDEYKISCPPDIKYNGENYILDGKPNNAFGTVNNNVTVTCKYTGKSKQTGDAFIYIICAIGIAALGFVIYYINKNNKTKLKENKD